MREGDGCRAPDWVQALDAGTKHWMQGPSIGCRDPQWHFVAGAIFSGVSGRCHTCHVLSRSSAVPETKSWGREPSGSRKYARRSRSEPSGTIRADSPAAHTSSSMRGRSAKKAAHGAAICTSTRRFSSKSRWWQPEGRVRTKGSVEKCERRWRRNGGFDQIAGARTRLTPHGVHHRFPSANHTRMQTQKTHECTHARMHARTHARIPHACTCAC